MAWNHLKTAIQIGSETEWGTEVSTSTAIGTVKSFIPQNRWDVVPIQGVGDGRDPQNFVKVRFNSRLTIVHEVHEFAMFKHAVGPLAGSGTAGSPYTITEADYTGVTSGTHIIPASIECGSDAASDDVDTYVGCFIDTFTLEATLGGVLTSTSQWICKKVVSSTTATSYTSPTTHPWVMSVESTLKYGGTPTTITGVRSANITFNNNLMIYGDWNTEFIAMPEAGQREITFSATVVMSSAVATGVRDDFYGQSNEPIDGEANAEPTADNELHLVFSQGSSTGHRNATIKLDQCMIEEISKPIQWGSSDVVLLNFSGRAKTSHTNVFATWWTA